MRHGGISREGQAIEVRAARTRPRWTPCAA
jgi:hypothetical protein